MHTLACRIVEYTGSGRLKERGREISSELRKKRIKRIKSGIVELVARSGPVGDTDHLSGLLLSLFASAVVALCGGDVGVTDQLLHG